MADNLAITAGTGTNVASDEVTYSGDTTKLGIVRLVHVTGSEGSKVVSELIRLEDAAHTSADPGIPMLGVRQDTATSLAGTDGDYTLPIFDASGRQHVNVGTSALPTGAATSAKQDTGNTSLASIDGKITAVNTGAVVLAAGVAAIGKLAANSGVDIGDVDVTTVGTITPGTAATSLGKAEDAAHSSGDVGVMGLTVRQDTAAALAGTDADYQPLITDASGRLHVNVGNTVTVGSHAVTNAGTFAVQAAEADGANVTLGAKADAKSTATDTTAISAMSVLKQISASVQAPPSQAVTNAGTFATQAVAAGDVAHDGADAGNPVKIGARARSSEITAVANNDRTDLLTDLVGKLITLPYANPENFVSGAISSAMTGTTSTSLIAAPASGLRNYITQITVSNSHATVGTDILIQDGSGGTTLYVIPAAAIYGGAVLTFPVPLRQPTTATAIYAQNVTTGANTKVSASGYKGA